MKFALGFLTACLLIILGIFFLAPEQAHEIIDKIHGKSAVQSDAFDAGTETEHTEGKATVPATTSESEKIDVVPEPITVESATVLSIEKQLLSWFGTHNYEVEVQQERGLYLISSRERKRTFSEPSGIVITGSGTVATIGNASTARWGKNVKFGQKYVSDIREDGISITASVTEEPDKNGYWWIETTRSFFWNSAEDDVQQVMSQAAALRSVGIIVTEGRSVYIR